MCHRWRLVDLWQSLPVVCVPVLVASSAPASWHMCSRCFTNLVLIPFDYSVNIILAHVSAKFRGHRIKDERDIIHFVLTVPAAPQPRCSRLARALPKICYSVCQILLPTGVSWTYTCLYKLVCPWLPRWPRCRGHINCYRCCPADSRAAHFAFTFPGQPILKMTYHLVNTYLIHSTTTPQNGFLVVAAMTMFLMIINPTVCWCAHPRCAGFSSCSTLNQWSNHWALLCDSVTTCTQSHQIPSIEVQRRPLFWWSQPPLPAGHVRSVHNLLEWCPSLI
jgi:hypothetical protein